MDLLTSLRAADGAYHRLERPMLTCEGWGPAVGDRGHQPCCGGTGGWVARRGRWVRNGRLYCGTCKRADEAYRDEQAEA